MSRLRPTLPGLLAVLLATGFLASPAQVQGQTLRFLSYPAVVNGTFDPDAGTVLTQTVTIRHRGAACVYFVTFSAGQSGSFAARRASSGANFLSYQIYDSMSGRNVLKDLTANPLLSEVLTGSFPASGATWITQNISYTVHLPPGQLPPAGTYSDTIAMEVYVGTPASHGARQQRVSFSLGLTVTAALDVSLVPTGAGFSASSTALTLDFGPLAAGGSRAGDLLVRSNSLNTITVMSQNGGVMKNYQLSVNGSAIALPAGVPRPIATSAPATGFSGTRYGVSVVIGSFGWATEGSYSDVLTIQAAAN
jgi:spore coat protein U-like protein